MARPRKIYSGTLESTRAAKFYERLHRLKDALEQIQEQYKADMTEVVDEASEALSVDPALIRQAFTQERQKRKREAKIAKMGASKAEQLEMLLDAASIASDGYDGLVDAVRSAGPRVADVKAHLAANEHLDDETGEITTDAPSPSNRDLSTDGKPCQTAVADGKPSLSHQEPLQGTADNSDRLGDLEHVDGGRQHHEGRSEREGEVSASPTRPQFAGRDYDVGDIPDFLRRTREPSMA